MNKPTDKEINDLGNDIEDEYTKFFNRSIRIKSSIINLLNEECRGDTILQKFACYMCASEIVISNMIHQTGNIEHKKIIKVINIFAKTIKDDIAEIRDIETSKELK